MLFKQSAFVAAALFTIISVASYAQGVTMPRTPSPASSVSQTIGISTVTVKYSRPAVKGREIWGSLVPYGWNKQGFGTGNEAPWRAGANENTVVEFSHDANVEGKMVPAGSYGLFFAVNPDNTAEVVLSKDYRSWAVFFMMLRMMCFVLKSSFVVFQTLNCLHMTLLISQKILQSYNLAGRRNSFL